MTTPTGSLEPNALVHNRYRVVRQIGRGGMGAVYEAVDTRLGNTVALKQTLVRGVQFDDAFAREARLLSSLRHAALPVVSDYFAEGESHFLVMQFIPGSDFGSLLAERTAPFGFAEVRGWADTLLDALDYLHTQNPPIIHRDLKPQNLKLTPRGEIVLLDFGLAKGGDLAQAGSVSLYGYTPQYAPLEQIKGTGTDPRSDLYSLGATLYALLANQSPVNALERASAVLQNQPDPLQPLHLLNPQVPTPVSRLISHCMALNPDERPPSAAAARAELAAAVRTGSAGASTAGMETIVQSAPPVTVAATPRMASPPAFTPGGPPPPPSVTRRPSMLVPAMVIGVAVVLCAVIGGASALLLRGAITTGTSTMATAIGEFDPTAFAIPSIVVPSITIPDVNATVDAVQTEIAIATGPFIQPSVESGTSFGTVVLQFGQEGTSDGFLNDPRAIAVGPDGAIYVADYSPGRVQRFSAEGTFERSWVLPDERPILAMTADREGLVYVTQNFAISVFDGATGELVRTITDANGDGFEEMITLGDGTLLGVPWGNDGDLVQLNARGEEINRISAIIANADADGSPSALAADGMGQIYVLDADAQVVYLFSSSGTFRDKFSTPSAWAFSQMAMDGQGRIYVTNFPKGISVFAPDGQLVGMIDVPGVAQDLVFDRENYLYVSTNAKQILKIAVAGQ
ncbi:serine/threonine protein kinase [Oscillochloris trichoides DG-6]|uniref:Serine/threonine protein kinase n=1 Tax=Oscillochloris trichoides DG-6 TaxID=765420 RepID=E1IHQ7_9CHLR|nr:protein kinase [Oscillochloris trichoides]EFO79277.1 serine/threonine protein kinase [Oscillochloris trichoides DG-6]